MTTENINNNALNESAEAIEKTTAIWAEHGTPRASNNVAIILSFFVSSVLTVIVAIVTQPQPSIKGNIAFPFNPRNFNGLFPITASLGKYPESSNKPNEIKNVRTIGKIMAIA